MVYIYIVIHNQITIVIKYGVVYTMGILRCNGNILWYSVVAYIHCIIITMVYL